MTKNFEIPFDNEEKSFYQAFQDLDIGDIELSYLDQLFQLEGQEIFEDLKFRFANSALIIMRI